MNLQKLILENGLQLGTTVNCTKGCKSFPTGLYTLVRFNGPAKSKMGIIYNNKLWAGSTRGVEFALVNRGM